jgi:transposase
VTMTMQDMASAQAGQDGVVASGGKGPRAGQPRRRTFTAAYKARILQEYDQLETGRERGALLRREGLYSSHIADWRKSRDTGAASALADKPAGRPGRSAEAVENERLRKENEKLTAELTRTKAALEVVGKAHALLELLSESADSNAKRQK